MTLDSSLSSSAADANDLYHNKRLPKGIHIIGTNRASGPIEGEVPQSESGRDAQNGKEAPPWGYIRVHHMSALAFEERLNAAPADGDFKPRCFVHRTVSYRKKPGGRGVVKEEKPTVSGLVFLQGETRQLNRFLTQNFPQYHLVNNCATALPASIPDSVMRPFMRVMEQDPARVTFLRDQFQQFARDHVRLRVLTGLLAGQEGYVVRLLGNRQLIMDLGGYAVAINNVHNEDFEIAE